jgi:hypothetical protein
MTCIFCAYLKIKKTMTIECLQMLYLVKRETAEEFAREEYEEGI